jgi:hypothetical protein
MLHARHAPQRCRARSEAHPKYQHSQQLSSIGVAVETQCRFEAGEWTATFNNSDDLWRYLCDHWRWWNWTGPEPRGLHRLTVFDSEIRRENSADTAEIMDPVLGAGLSAKDMLPALRIADDFIKIGPSVYWAAL